MRISEKPSVEQQALLTVDAVAGLLGVSTRHIYRLADGGKIPKPIRLGASVRWNRKTLLDWIDSNCPEIEGFSR